MSYRTKQLTATKAKMDSLKAFMSTPESVAMANEEFERTMAAVMSHRIKEIRQAKLLTQEEVAKLMGVRQPEIARLEKGETSPTFSTMFKFMSALNVRMELIY